MKKHFTQLYHYELWANRKVLTLLSSLEEVPERVAEIFSHLLSAQMVWYERLAELPKHAEVWPVFPQEEWEGIMETNSERLLHFIENQEDVDFESLCCYQNSKGQEFQQSYREILSHLSLHAAYHRGQIIVLVKPLGASLPATDFIFYLREKV